MVQITKAGRIFSGAFLILLACCSAALGVQQPNGNQQVTLGWIASPDPTVVGYYLYYGTSSEGCTNKINVGTNTEFIVGGLVPGSTYYFTETAYNAASVESSFVPQISYLVPGVLTMTQNPTNGAMRIQFPVAAGQSYVLQTSSNLESWSNLLSTGTQATNEWLEYDEPVTNTVPARFFRLVMSGQ
jgi:hypothetical protein